MVLRITYNPLISEKGDRNAERNFIKRDEAGNLIRG
jgi:hypothetical protein